jgi:hypothetical protein
MGRQVVEAVWQLAGSQPVVAAADQAGQIIVAAADASSS